MSQWLLDTSVVIDFLRRKDKENTLFYKLSSRLLFISIVTHTEIFAGKSVWEKSATRKIVNEVLSELEIIPLTRDISEKAGYIKAHRPEVSIIDAIIAATSLMNNKQLVTLNTKHFEKIAGIKIFIPKKLF